MSRSNILISSAGRRVELVKEFRKELKDLFPDAKVFAADCSPELSAACQVADDYIKVPKVKDPKYIDVLLNHCIINSIGIIVPTIDTELILYAESRERFKENGIEIIVSDPDFVKTCRNKRLTINLFHNRDIETPEIIDITNPKFPIFAKPMDGSRSIGIRIINDTMELDVLMKKENFIFQESIDTKEHMEFTVDIYYGKDSKIKSIVPRERLEVRDGEVSKAITRKNLIISFLKKRLEFVEGARGPTCIQVFMKKNDCSIKGIEINPRFGGGYPLSYAAGANFPKMIIEEYFLHKELEYKENWLENLFMLRYDSQIIMKANSIFEVGLEMERNTGQPLNLADIQSDGV